MFSCQDQQSATVSILVASTHYTKEYSSQGKLARKTNTKCPDWKGRIKTSSIYRCHNLTYKKLLKPLKKQLEQINIFSKTA